MKQKVYLGIVIFVVFLSILPLAGLSFYNHPSADDFSYSEYTCQEFRKHKSAARLIQAAAKTSRHYWNTWQGLYTSAFILSLQPAIFGERYYALTGILMLAIIFAGNVILASYLIRRVLGGEWLQGIAVGCMMSFLMVQWMPSFVEGLYWFNGAMNYVLFFSLTEALICAAIHVGAAKNPKSSALCLAGTSLLGVLIAGGNHVTAFMEILFLAGISLCGFCFRAVHRLRWNLIPLAASVAGFVLNVISPGTKIRQEYFEKPGIVFTVKEAVLKGLDYINGWIGISLIVCILALLPVIYGIVYQFRLNTGFRFPCPLLVCVLSVGFICAMFCPPLYAMGNLGAGRLLNIVYFAFIALMFFNVFYLCGWVQEALVLSSSRREPDKRLSGAWCVTALCLCLGMGLASGNESGMFFATGMLLDGTAAQYSQEAFVRHEQLLAGEGKAVEVEAYSVWPPLLFFDDITVNPKDWKNRAVRDYYGLKSVKIKE